MPVSHVLVQGEDTLCLYCGHSGCCSLLWPHRCGLWPWTFQDVQTCPGRSSKSHHSKQWRAKHWSLLFLLSVPNINTRGKRHHRAMLCFQFTSHGSSQHRAQICVACCSCTCVDTGRPGHVECACVMWKLINILLLLSPRAFAIDQTQKLFHVLATKPH